MGIVEHCSAFGPVSYVAACNAKSPPSPPPPDSRASSCFMQYIVLATVSAAFMALCVQERTHRARRVQARRLLLCTLLTAALATSPPPAERGTRACRLAAARLALTRPCTVYKVGEPVKLECRDWQASLSFVLLGQPCAHHRHCADGRVGTRTDVQGAPQQRPPPTRPRSTPVE